MRALLALGQLFVLNVIYLIIIIFSLGLLFGPATSALFCLTTKIIQKRYEASDVIKQFITLIKGKIRFALYLEILLIVVGYLCTVNLENIFVMNYPVFLQKSIIVVQYIVLIETSLIFLIGTFLHGNYEFAEFSDLLKMSFYIAHRHILTTIIVVASMFLIIYFVFNYLHAVLILLLFSLLAFWVSILYLPICKRYVIVREINNE